MSEPYTCECVKVWWLHTCSRVCVQRTRMGMIIHMYVSMCRGQRSMLQVLLFCHLIFSDPSLTECGQQCSVVLLSLPPRAEIARMGSHTQLLHICVAGTLYQKSCPPDHHHHV